MATSISQNPPVRLPGEPLSDREAQQATVYRLAKSRTLPKWPSIHRYKTFFARGSSAPVRVKCEDGVAAWLVGTQVFRDTYRLHRKSYGPIRVSFWVSCSWRSEGLFGQSLSLALLIQVLRGLPCLELFSVVWCVRHIEGPPGWGPTL